LFLLVGVAFFTLFERKILGYIHMRVGPNKVGLLGVMQAFRDALRLFRKEDLRLNGVSYYIFFISSISGFFLILVFWYLFPYWGGISFMVFSIVIFFCVRSLGVYFLLYCGWGCMSRYSVFGGYRSSAQAISYEVVMVVCVLFLCLILSRLSLTKFRCYLSYFRIYILRGGILFCWVISCIAECNRSPFDFSEGESELVSGFNTEYGSGLFSMIFIGEYRSIIFFRIVTGFLYFIGVFAILVSVFIFFIFLWIRGSFPRLRYDRLMIMAWRGLFFFVVGPLLLVFIF